MMVYLQIANSIVHSSFCHSCCNVAEKTHVASAVYSEVRWTLGSILDDCLGFLCLTCHILICWHPDTIPYTSWSWKDHDHIIDIIWFTFKVSHYFVEIHVKHLQYHKFQQIYCLRELLPRHFRRLTLRFVGIFLALALRNANGTSRQLMSAASPLDDFSRLEEYRCEAIYWSYQRGRWHRTQRVDTYGAHWYTGVCWGNEFHFKQGKVGYESKKALC